MKRAFSHQDDPPAPLTSAEELEPEMSAVAPKLELVPRPAFEQVYAEHFAMVWRLCANRVPAASLDDVVQEVFLVVHRKLAEFEGRSTVRTWVYGIVRRVVRDYTRAAHNRPLGAPLPEDLIDERALPLEVLARKRALAVLDEALARMNDDQREAFLLVEVEQMTSREAAELLEASDNTIRARVRAARATFAAAVARHHARQRWGDHE